MNKQPATPPIDGIRSGLIVEGQHYEFKARLNLDEQRGKSNFIDDVVSFLNAGPGYLIVGVHEKKGVFARFEPMDGDRDAFPNASAASLGRPIRVERVSEQDLVDRFYDKVRSVSVYGR